MTVLDQSAADLQAACSAFLYREAAALDAHDYAGWLAMLAPDVTYRIPVRTVRAHGIGEHSTTAFYLHETFETLRTRVDRFATGYAWAEDPPSRTRHCVSNVLVDPVEGRADELAVCSNIVLLRYTMGQAMPDIASGERRDVLRLLDRAWKLAARVVLLDGSVLGMHNFAVFL